MAVNLSNGTVDDVWLAGCVAGAAMELVPVCSARRRHVPAACCPRR